MITGQSANGGAIGATRKERSWVALLCAAAALRVFIYCAAFPVFCNVDEIFHYALVTEYSHGQPPRRGELLLAEAAHAIAYQGTPEYAKAPDAYATGRFPQPPWTLPTAEARDAASGIYAARWGQKPNHEASQAPLYYWVAGAWLALGRMWISGEGMLPYWVRFLNVFVAAALVWLAYVAARMIFPERGWLRIGAPAMMAFFPQAALYTIQSDVLSPLCFGLAFVGMAKLFRDEAPGRWIASMTGLALAATCLVKVSNAPLLLPALTGMGWIAARRAKGGKLRSAWPAFALFAVIALAPVVLWMAWNRYVYGDLTGSNQKMAILGWTRKPFGEWWNHPIFTARGFGTFISELLSSFWRGELVWWGRTLRWPGVDALYWMSSVALIGLGAASLLRGGGEMEPWRRRTLWLGFWSFVILVGFLGLISTMFDFGPCVNPSREHPYFTSGRLLSPVMIPFLLLYLRGMDWAFGRVKWRRAAPGVLAVLITVITASEIVINLPPFSSQYNLIHRLARGDQ